jgi:hypothetical protein
MENYTLKEDEITCSLEDYISLLEYKLICLKKAYEEDSSWNYSIDKLEKTIAELKTKL